MKYASLTAVPAQTSAGWLPAAGALANSVNDPTAPLLLVQIRNAVAPTVPGAADGLQIEPVILATHTQAG